MMDALLIPLAAQVAIRHRQNLRALTVRKLIGGKSFTFAEVLVQRQLAGERILIHFRECTPSQAGRKVEVRSPLGRDDRSSFLREALLDPNIIPPSGRDHVAKPLMRELMRN